MNLITEIYDRYRGFGIKFALSYGWWYITRPFKKVYRFVIKLFKYSRLLWNDSEFDYSFLLELLQFKLTLMAQSFEKHGISVNSRKISKELKLCADLIQRIIEDKYADIELEHIDRKYGELVWESTPVEGNKNLATLHLYRKKALEGTAEYKQMMDESRKAYKNAELQKQRDIDYLCDTMKKRMQLWWD